jgi:hypothetical protein
MQPFTDRTPQTICRKFINGKVREEEDETHNEAEEGLRAFVLIVEVLEEV